MRILAASIALIVFSIGSAGLILKRNLIMKLLSLNIINTSSILFLLSLSYRQGAQAPIIQDAINNQIVFADPLPQALVLTAIVINFGILALTLIFTIGIVKNYHTLDVKRIEKEAQKGYTYQEETLEQEIK
jgi:multicomponent Na+:H+ antiporter subunit C